MRSTTCIIHILPDYAILPFTKACHDKQAIRCHSTVCSSAGVGNALWDCMGSSQTLQPIPGRAFVQLVVFGPNYHNGRRGRAYGPTIF